MDNLDVFALLSARVWQVHDESRDPEFGVCFNLGMKLVNSFLMMQPGAVVMTNMHQ